MTQRGANGFYVSKPASPSRPLRIAQLAPLYESVPPKLYGGTERIVAYLTEALIARGHSVTLYASGDSTCRAPLRAAWPQGLRLAGLDTIGAGYQLLSIGDVFEHADEFDVIHSHVDHWTFPFARLVRTPTVVTIHGRVDVPEIAPLYDRFQDIPLVSISDAQRRPLPQMNWTATVPHGLPADLLTFNPKGGDYLAFIGRISPEKRPDLAIYAARKAGIPLKIAAKVDKVNLEYFHSEIKPLLSGPGVEYIGEIGEKEKNDFLGNALAMMFPIDWPEPFGLVMIEALACGTPVITRPCGSVPEVIRDGVTGFVVSTVEELANAARRVGEISRKACREEFERRFTADLMAANYEEIYRRLVNKNVPEQEAPRPRAPHRETTVVSYQDATNLTRVGKSSS